MELGAHPQAERRFAVFFCNMAASLRHRAFGFPRSSTDPIFNTGFWAFITCREALGRRGDAVGSTIGVIAALLTLPLGAAEISGSQWLSPSLQIRSASGFCRRRRLIAQARDRGVSC